MANTVHEKMEKARRAKFIWQAKYKSGKSPKLDSLARLSGKVLFYMRHNL